MNLSDVTKQAGSHKRRKRVGRGNASGKGGTCGRGHKGCNSRSGGGVRQLTEGGQMPLFRRLPKRGFNNAQFRTLYEVVNVGDLEARFEVGATVNRESLAAAGLIRSGKRSQPIKILGEGTLSKKMTVEADKFSKSAVQKIASAGGEARTIGG